MQVLLNFFFNGGIYHFKHHLACTRKDVDPCQQVLEDVKKMILNVSVKNQKATKKERLFNILEQMKIKMKGKELAQWTKKKE